MNDESGKLRKRNVNGERIHQERGRQWFIEKNCNEMRGEWKIEGVKV